MTPIYSVHGENTIITTMQEANYLDFVTAVQKEMQYPAWIGICCSISRKLVNFLWQMVQVDDCPSAACDSLSTETGTKVQFSREPLSLMASTIWGRPLSTGTEQSAAAAGVTLYDELKLLWLFVMATCSLLSTSWPCWVSWLSILSSVQKHTQTHVQTTQVHFIRVPLLWHRVATELCSHRQS